MHGSRSRTPLLLASLLAWTLALPAQQHPYPTSPAHPAPAWFVDVAPQAGLTVRNTNGSPTNKQYIVESTGSGVAVIDYDNDGWPDLYFANGAQLPQANAANAPAKPDTAPPTGHLFHNNHDGTFTDVTGGSGLDETFWGQGACVGDYDNDGLPDLFVTAYGRNRLYHNEGRGHFREVGVSAGAAGNGKEWSTGCAFVDYDRDGRLDIAIATYVHFDLAKTPKPGAEAGCMWKGAAVMCGPRGLPYSTNILLHNDGPAPATTGIQPANLPASQPGKAASLPHFTDVSHPAGIQQTPGHYCFSVTTLDYNEDGWPDIYVACDSTPAILYRNNRDGTFTDVAGEQGVAFNEDGREQAGMGSTAADFDGDGHLDLFKTNFSDDTSTLYHASGDGSYTDATSADGLAINTESLGWGAMFADLDNDGYPDLLIANGHVYPEVDEEHLGSTFKQPRLFYRNLGNGHFQDLSKTSGPGLTEPLSGRGLAIADLWNDGRLEAIVNNLSDRPMLLVNVAPDPNHWLGLRLLDTHGRDALGARITLYGTQAGKPRVWVDEVRSGSSYSSSSDLRLHIGLGPQPKLTTLDIRWPDGTTTTVPAPPLDAITTLTERPPSASSPAPAQNRPPR